jgi:hypothetical protein
VKIININSKKIAVQLDNKILGELIEIENVVEKVGQFGNITKYKLAVENDRSVLYLDLQEDYRKFALLPTMTPAGDVNKVIDETGKTYEVVDTTPKPTDTGEQVVSATDSTGNEVLVDPNKVKPKVI